MHFTRLLMAFGLAVMLSGATCSTRPPPVVVPVSGSDWCGPACENLQRLGCEEGEPLEDGTSCSAFCEETQKQGHPLNPRCVAHITSCDLLDSCNGAP